LAGASGMIIVGLAFFGSYATMIALLLQTFTSPLYREPQPSCRAIHPIGNCNCVIEYANFAHLNEEEDR
jgi:hypothetical protein